MSQEAHGHHHVEVHRPLAITPFAWVFLLISILAAIMMGTFVVASSGFGRIWPAGDSVKLELPPQR